MGASSVKSYDCEYSTKSSTITEDGTSKYSRNEFVPDKWYFWDLRVMKAYCCNRGGRSKKKNVQFCWCSRAVEDGVKIICLAYTLTSNLTLNFTSTSTPTIRDRATLDTYKPEVQPLSGPESLHSCVFS